MNSSTQIILSMVPRISFPYISESGFVSLIGSSIWYNNIRPIEGICGLQLRQINRHGTKKNIAINYVDSG